MKYLRGFSLLIVAFFFTSCLSSRTVQRSFYVMHSTSEAAPIGTVLKGLIRVRDLNAESVYDKFQIVIRRSPWQLRYSGFHLWAVRPQAMISDIIARTLQETGVFAAVTRELSEARPDFVMSGELHAVEIYDSDDIWYAHLALSLRVSRFDDGQQLWTFDFDERKLVGDTDFAHAVRAMSELMDLAMRRAVVSLIDSAEGVGGEKVLEDTKSLWRGGKPILGPQKLLRDRRSRPFRPKKPQPEVPSKAEPLIIPEPIPGTPRPEQKAKD